MELAYHYTTVETFLKILDNSICRNQGERLKDFIFWASSIYAMNDPQELLFGFNLLWDEGLPIIERELGITSKDVNRVSNVWKGIEGKYKQKELNERLIKSLYESHHVPFVVSFSKHEDSLPMWNTYSQNASGICLGFKNYEYEIKYSKNDLYDVIINNKLHALDVFYGTLGDTTMKVLKKLYQNCYENIQKENDSNKKQRIKKDFLCTSAITALAYIKHKAYEYESEARLIQFKKDESDVHLRCNANGRIIPFIEVPIKSEYLIKIVVGPSADYELINRELSTKLKRFGLNVEIKKSSIPYINV